MQKDTALTWENGFPYDVLAEVGITPAASMETVREAVFRLSKERRAAARPALRELEEIPRRLVVDYFLYQGPVSPEEVADHEP